MGLIKSIFGAIFGLIGGIFKTVGGLVGLGKKSEFFLEADEATEASLPAADPVPAAKTEVKAAEAPAATKAPTESKTAAKSKTAVKSAPAPTPVAAAVAEPVPTGFASTYLNSPSTAGRRRPGPSLSPFRDMAKQVKVR
jgi:hypothetical protein